MKKIILIVFVVLLASYILISSKKSAAPIIETKASQTIDIKGLNYSYDLKEIKVKVGEKVQINFTNTEGFHDFKIDEFNVATKQIPSGASESVVFTPDKAGTFEYYCSVGQHRANGMWGKLIVE